jgi:hypothetical protein
MKGMQAASAYLTVASGARAKNRAGNVHESIELADRSCLGLRPDMSQVDIVISLKPRDWLASLSAGDWFAIAVAAFFIGAVLLKHFFPTP